MKLSSFLADKDNRDGLFQFVQCNIEPCGFHDSGDGFNIDIGFNTDAIVAEVLALVADYYYSEERDVELLIDNKEKEETFNQKLYDSNLDRLEEIFSDFNGSSIDKYSTWWGFHYYVDLDVVDICIGCKYDKICGMYKFPEDQFNKDSFITNVYGLQELCRIITKKNLYFTDVKKIYQNKDSIGGYCIKLSEAYM